MNKKGIIITEASNIYLISLAVNQTRYGKIMVVRLTTDQQSHSYMTMVLGCICYTMRRSLLLLRDLSEL